MSKTQVISNSLDFCCYEVAESCSETQTKLNYKNINSFCTHTTAERDFSAANFPKRSSLKIRFNFFSFFFFLMQCFSFGPNILQAWAECERRSVRTYSHSSTRYQSVLCQALERGPRKLPLVESTMWKLCEHYVIPWPSQDRTWHTASIWCALHRGRNMLSQTSFH